MRGYMSRDIGWADDGTRKHVRLKALLNNISRGARAKTHGFSDTLTNTGSRLKTLTGRRIWQPCTIAMEMAGSTKYLQRQRSITDPNVGGIVFLSLDEQISHRQISQNMSD